MRTCVVRLLLATVNKDTRGKVFGKDSFILGVWFRFICFHFFPLSFLNKNLIQYNLYTLILYMFFFLAVCVAELMEISWSWRCTLTASGTPARLPAKPVSNSSGCCCVVICIIVVIPDDVRYMYSRHLHFVTLDAALTFWTRFSFIDDVDILRLTECNKFL